MAALPAREVLPQPLIGKSGSYTVFLTPPATLKPQSSSPYSNPNSSSSPKKAVPFPSKTTSPPPIQVPPQQFEKPRPRSSGSGLGFFWDAVAKVQDVHSSLDKYLADWFGLNQSKYQWALNDYYQNKGMDKESGRPKELYSKGQAV